MNKQERILSVLRKHPNEWMSAGDIARQTECRKWATAQVVSAYIATNMSVPCIEHRMSDVSYNPVKQYRYCPEAA